MLTKWCLLLLCSLCSLNTLVAQPAKHRQQIALVEHGLPLGVRFADSLDVTYKLSDRMKFYQVPSVSITVIDKGKIAWSKSYGYADLAAKRPSTTTTLYQTASISKSVNAVAILQLVESGKLSLTEDIRNYLISWVFPENDFSRNKPITLAQLLSHTAGIGTEGFFGYEKTASIPTLNDILNGVPPANSAAVKPVGTPGETFAYSGGGITLSRKIMEDQLGSDYATIVRNVVLQPLKMRNSTYEEPAARKREVAAGYFGSYQQVPGKYHLFPELAPDGLWSTSADIAKLVLSIQQSLAGKPSILTQATAARMLTPVLASSTYALGVTVEAKGAERYFSHRGANYGYRTVFYGSARSGKGVVVLTNAESAEPLINEIVNSVAITYKWSGFYTPPVKRIIHLLESVRNGYVGTYKQGEATFIIKQQGEELYMTGGGTEKLYATGNHTFFLLSNPNVRVVFSNSADNTRYDVLEIIEGEKQLLKATRE